MSFVNPDEREVQDFQFYIERRSQQTGQDWGSIIPLANKYGAYGDQWIVEKVILEPLLDNLEEQTASVLRDVPIGVLPIRAVNAHVLRSPLNEPVVIVDKGLMMMVSHYMESLVVSKYLFEQRGMEAAHINLMNTYKFIVDYFANNGSMSYPLEYSKVPEDYLLSSTLYTLAIETYIILHELAHIYLGHFEDAETRSFSMVAEDKSTEHTIHVVQHKHRQELEADIMAWRWYEQVRGKIQTVGDQHQATPIYFFALLNLVEKNLVVPDRFSSHPPAVMRASILSRLWESESYLDMVTSVPDAEDLATFIEQNTDGTI